MFTLRFDLPVRMNCTDSGKSKLVWKSRKNLGSGDHTLLFELHCIFGV